MEHNFFDQVLDALTGSVPAPLGRPQSSVHRGGLKVWFHESTREHYEAQLLGVDGELVLEIGFHAEHPKAALNDDAIARLTASEPAWRKALGAEPVVGEFLGRPNWRRISETWPAPDLDDIDASIEVTGAPRGLHHRVRTAPPKMRRVVRRYAEHRHWARADPRFVAAWPEIDAADGWLSKREAEFLFTLASVVARGEAVVEIGSYKGRSTIALASGVHAGVPVYTVDPHTGCRFEVEQGLRIDTWTEFPANVARAGATPVIPIRSTSVDAAASYGGPKVGMLFIDGWHSTEAVVTDFTSWKPHLASDPAVVFVDWFDPDIGAPSTSLPLHSLVESERSGKMSSSPDACQATFDVCWRSAGEWVRRRFADFVERVRIELRLREHVFGHPPEIIGGDTVEVSEPGDGIEVIEGPPARDGATAIATRRVAAVRDRPQGRLDLLRSSYAPLPGAPPLHLRYRRAALAFMGWQVRRGLLNPLDHERPGSPWWRAVNERLLHDTCEARSRVLGYTGPASSSSVKASVRFARQPSPRAWYRAHNVTIVSAYLDHRDLAERENEVERFFINLVLIRLLYAHALVATPRLALAWLAPTAPWLGDPRPR